MWYYLCVVLRNEHSVPQICDYIVVSTVCNCIGGDKLCEKKFISKIACREE